MNPPLVRLQGITKYFGAFAANDDISLALYAGQITALLGENGAGKSTLMSILAGRRQPDAGRIEVDGVRRRFRSAREAIECGIGMVYQHFALVENMSVAENVLLGEQRGFARFPRKDVRRVQALADEYGFEVDAGRRVADLSMGERQRVEILKLLNRKSRVLIFDEPTAVLTPPETERLFAGLRRMAERGKAVVFISHKLNEVLNIADKIAVLRQGRTVAQVDRAEVHRPEDLASMMVGRRVIFTLTREAAAPGSPVLELREAAVPGLKPVSFSLRKGEILAVVGVAGNGQGPLMSMLSGETAPTTGTLLFFGQPASAFFSSRLAPYQLAVVPEDRLGQATCPHLTLAENFLLTTRREYVRFGLIDGTRAEADCRAALERFGVKPAEPAVVARRLSGGNLQKLVLAREMHRHPRLLLVEQPTQGLDVAATEEVWRHLLEARKQAGVVLVTGDVTEALTLADKVAVLFRGRISAVFDAATGIDQERIASAMAGLGA